MSNVNTRIDEIVDITAAIALVEVAGVARAFGVGSGLVDHPLIPGGTIRPAGSAPIEPFTHWSDVPESGNLPLQAMRGTHMLTWVIPMKLLVERGDLEETRRILAPFPARYIGAFTSHLTLRGSVSQIASIGFRVESDDNWAWLATRLTVVERLHLDTQA